MGRMALIIVVGLSITIGIVGFSLNKSKSGVVENVAGFQKYSMARNIAHTGVNMMLRHFDEHDTGTYIGPLERGETVWQVSSIMAGQCSVSIKLPNLAARDTVDMTSRSTYMDTVYSMKLRLRRSPKPFPSVNAAVGLASAPINFKMNGTPNIDGSNWNMNGTRGDPAFDTLGVAVINAAESSLVAPYVGNITGDPRPLAVAPPPDPAAYVNEYINGADIVFADGSSNGGVYGSPSVPVIGYLNGAAKFAGNGKFYGILVVHGTVEFNGTFDLYGLVIAYGDSNTISVSTSSGTPQIWGSVLVTGPANSSFTMKGTADVNYSREALQMAMYISKLQAYRVVKWYESY